MKLSSKEQLRYSRHLLTGNVGEEGQLKFKATKVLIVGVGGLGCSVAQYLAAAGIGELILVDHDSIELSNLQRQVLYKTNHVKASKVLTAQKQLLAANPEIKVTALNASIFDVDIASTFNHADIVVDCTDSIKTRNLINAQCLKNRVKLVSGAAINGQGQLISFDFTRHDSPCYKCLFPDNEETHLNCSTAGVLGPLLGIIGSLQATEVCRLILGMNQNVGRLTLIDVWDMSFNHFNVKKVENCTTCDR